jgi:predicted RNA-binding protein with EMAP domain
MRYQFKELGKVVSKSAQGVRVAWIGHEEVIDFEQLKDFKVGQWFSVEATREGESYSLACPSKTLEVQNLKRIGSLDRKLSDEEWKELLSEGIEIPKVSWKDL